MLISNIAVEVDINKYWSVTLPVYYSALNYFTRTRKLRTLAFQPEVRWWFSPQMVCGRTFRRGTVQLCPIIVGMALSRP